MPMELTRSFIVIIIPGAILVAPWAFLVFLWLGLWELYQQYQLLLNAILIGTSIVFGLVVEDIVTYFENELDEEREKELTIRANWDFYLSTPLADMPIGYRYIGRLVERMYFEMTMMVAGPISLIGISIICFELGSPDKLSCIEGWICLPPGDLGFLVFMLLSVPVRWFFRWQARDTHEVLNSRRQVIIKELKKREKKNPT